MERENALERVFRFKTQRYIYVQYSWMKELEDGEDEEDEEGEGLELLD